jgi:heme-degrading monooxygenase HmoA
MYARSTTTQGNPQMIDDAIAYLRDEVMPVVQGMEGCVGLSMLADRQSGRCIATSAWESEEAMHDSESGMHDMRMRYAEKMGSRPEVAEWEIAVLHRKHTAPEGACCRVLWTKGDPATADDALDSFRMAMLPRMEELPGFCSVSLLVNRETGMATTSTVYATRDDMNRATEMATPMREEFMRQTGGELTDVAEFDLVVHHLRVPETV